MSDMGHPVWGLMAHTCQYFNNELKLMKKQCLKKATANKTFFLIKA